MFGGIPLIAWIGYGFATRNPRTARFEEQLRDARSRDELEGVALKWEFALMMRLLGPHQGIRLERLRAELDDHFEALGHPLSSIESASIEQTHLMDDLEPKALIELPTHPNKDMVPDQASEGYEWLNHAGRSFYRVEGSGANWELYGD